MAAVEGMSGLARARSLATLAGEEARDLARLDAAGVPVARGRLVPLDGAAEELEAALAGPVVGGRAWVRALAPSLAERRAVEPRGPSDLGPSDDWVAAAAAWSTVQARDVVLRVVHAEEGPWGCASSVDPRRGDPDVLAVWQADSPDAAWRIDRRSTRVEVPGEGLGVVLAERVADLVDRVQLVLGLPVAIEWVVQDGRPKVLTARPSNVEPGFLEGRWRRVALVAADEGTVAPLAIDTLDRALREVGAEDVAVRRIYARPYRWREPVVVRLGEGTRLDLARAASDAGRVTLKVAPTLRDALAFERAFPERAAGHGARALAAMGDEALLAELAERQRFVAEGLAHLDACRSATRLALGALEGAAGPLRREQHAALAAVRHVRPRRRFHAKLAKLAKDIEDTHGGLVSASELSAPLRRRFDELRASAATLRPLGVDVAPVPYGRDDETFLQAMRTRPRPGLRARERARQEALDRAVEQAGRGLGGRARAALVRGLGALSMQIARAKGGAAEGVATALLALREVACEVGARLVRAAVLDEPEDALYLSARELEEALLGEPGAYAARVRLRREDDLRWAAFVAPRRVGRG
ncbi:MAG: hypothetical protein KF901_30920 [Myxococcales bacterium]|nr:hypothetical protein [Myxococcales bacterium]